MKFRHCFFKILKNKNVRMDGHENIIPPPLGKYVDGGGGEGDIKTSSKEAFKRNNAIKARLHDSECITNGLYWISI